MHFTKDEAKRRRPFREGNGSKDRQSTDEKTTLPPWVQDRVRLKN